MTVMISVSSELKEMIPICPFLFKCLKIPEQKLLIVKKMTSGQKYNYQTALKYRSHINNSYMSSSTNYKTYHF